MLLLEVKLMTSHVIVISNPKKSPNFAISLPQIIHCYVFSTMLSNVYNPSTLILHHTIFAYMYVVYRKKAATSAWYTILSDPVAMTLKSWPVNFFINLHISKQASLYRCCVNTGYVLTQHSTSKIDGVLHACFSVMYQLSWLSCDNSLR